ncbi:MAG: OB-fold nucleic acid binding domain-containing protein, partial [Candidatus Micrarchaeia archaeon]
MKQFIKDLKIGEKVDSLFSVKYKHPIKEYTNGLMFLMGVADKTGEIEVTYWGNFDKTIAEKIHKSFSENDVIRIKGNVGEYKKKTKIDVNEPEGKIEITKEYDLEDFIPITDKNIEEMYEELKKYINSINDKNLKSLLNQFFEDETFIKIFKKCP